MTSPCEDIEYKLIAYMDQELSNDEKTHIEAHLKDCPYCQRRLKELKQSSGLVHDVLKAPPTVDFEKAWHHIEPRIKCRPGLMEKLRACLSAPTFWIPAGAAAAVCAAALFFAILHPATEFKARSRMSRVESVSSKTENVMVLQSAQTRQPIIWIMEKPKKETHS